jgi:hypothetical protein
LIASILLLSFWDHISSWSNCTCIAPRFLEVVYFHDISCQIFVFKWIYHLEGLLVNEDLVYDAKVVQLECSNLVLIKFLLLLIVFLIAFIALHSFLIFLVRSCFLFLFLYTTFCYIFLNPSLAMQLFSKDYKPNSSNLKLTHLFICWLKFPDCTYFHYIEIFNGAAQALRKDDFS